MKAFESNDFKVLDLTELKSTPTLLDLNIEEDALKKSLKKTRKKLAAIQNALYAHGKYGVLICLQGMDTAGKDSLVREVFKDFNVRGVVVHSFKVPTSKELQHDYLWRHYIALPERGKFAVFNRTHYENVLVTRVHPSYILNENIPGIHSTDDIDEPFWNARFEQINHFEKHIAANGVIILKFFLHLSKNEQKNRLLRRLELPNKNWKFSPGDLKERKLWDQYQASYEDALCRTSKTHAPWYVIPADHKWTARYMVAKIMLDELEKYQDIKEPELDQEVKANIENYKKELLND